MKRDLFRPQCRRGFSLAESMISVGIVSSVLLAVVGMLAGTLGGAQDTKMETVAAMVVRQMAAEARADVERVASPDLPLVNVLMVDGAMQTMAHSRVDAGLIETFQTGSEDLRAMYFARSKVTPSEWVRGMFELHVTVESPASAMEGKRKVRRYVSLISP
jgi:Tfp pilus assembly protein PilV